MIPPIGDILYQMLGTMTRLHASGLVAVAYGNPHSRNLPISIALSPSLNSKIATNRGQTIATKISTVQSLIRETRSDPTVYIETVGISGSVRCHLVGQLWHNFVIITAVSCILDNDDINRFIAHAGQNTLLI